MKTQRAWWFGLCLGVSLILGFRFVPALVAAPVESPIVGQWRGTLDPGAQPKKRILVHIAQEQDGTLSGTIDYPDQDTSGIKMTAISYTEPTLHFESSSNRSAFDGTMNKDNSEIAGTWRDGGAPVSLVLKRTP